MGLVHRRHSPPVLSQVLERKGTQMKLQKQGAVLRLQRFGRVVYVTPDRG